MQAYIAAHRLTAEANAMCAQLQQDVSFSVEAHIDGAGVRSAVFSGTARSSNLVVRGGWGCVCGFVGRWPTHPTTLCAVSRYTQGVGSAGAFKTRPQDAHQVPPSPRPTHIYIYK
jgi:hypothetical protein